MKMKGRHSQGGLAVLDGSGGFEQLGTPIPAVLMASPSSRGSPGSSSPSTSTSPVSSSPLRKGSESKPMARTNAKKAQVVVGRTQQIRRKEPQQTDKHSSNQSKRSRKSQDQNGDVIRKTSTTARAPGSRGLAQLQPDSKGSKLQQPPPALTVSITPAAGAATTTVNVPLSTTEDLEERRKFDQLWEVKSVDVGRVRIPSQLLDGLIRKENIDKVYVVEDKPVASGGLFATVRKCSHRETGVTYAAKFATRFREGIDCSMEILHEIAMLSVCRESNKIVHLKDVFENRQEIILVLEYAPGGDFQSILDEDMVPFEEDVHGFLRQILEALQFVHEKNIAHLDIKPQNIVLMGQFPNCEIKLCDLEVARIIQQEEEIREIIGTPDYVAPEVLAWEPVTLAADIWSLGVLAYVLLTGFSPFGGETEQETLRNISTAELDFPDELFEGVSDDAKDFITRCLDRDPNKRPTVKECLQHSWLADEEEPPSPSPLTLKIPTPDTFHRSMSYHGTSAAPGGQGGGSRRSCQTCRDKITERKRYLSKSREVIFEKVAANSNLKKSLSKSRERLYDVRLTVSKSRDRLNDGNKLVSRHRDKFNTFKTLSKTEDIFSTALGGTMKRMVNGAASDISHGPPMTSTILNDTDNTLDLVLVPRGHLLMSHPDLLLTNSGALQMVPITESEPGSTCCSNDLHPADQTQAAPPEIEPLLEVSEEEDEENPDKKVTSVAVQVNMTKSKSSPNLAKGAKEDATSTKLRRDTVSAPRSPVTKDDDDDNNKSCFTHRDDGKRNYTWRREMDKFRTNVSTLIGTFETDETEKKRRKSLQIPLDDLAVGKKDDDEPKRSQRRKSTSAVMLKNTNVQDKKSSKLLNNNSSCKEISEVKAVEKSETGEEANEEQQVEEANEEQQVEEANEEQQVEDAQPRKKNWDYFEIDHPKAISEKKLQQLKLKYQRRKTEAEVVEDARDDSNPSSRRSSRSSWRRSSNLADIQEQIIPEEKVLEVRINPLSGSVEAVEVGKFKVDVHDDDGIGSLPDTPTDHLEKPPKLKVRTRDETGVLSSSEETLPTSLLSWDDFGRSSSVQTSFAASNGNLSSSPPSSTSSNSAMNTVSRTCTGAFNRAMERYNNSISSGPRPSEHLDDNVCAIDTHSSLLGSRPACS